MSIEGVSKVMMDDLIAEERGIHAHADAGEAL